LLPGDLYGFLPGEKERSTEFAVKINGKQIDQPLLVKGYAVIDRSWEKGDFVELSLPMEVKYVTGNSKIEDAREKVVITRGPLVYCLEEADNPAYFAENNEPYLLPKGFEAKYHKELLGGVVTLKGHAALLKAEDQIDITAIPYYAWSNRGQGQMKVWLPYTQK
jgi:DUF1680 family protein